MQITKGENAMTMTDTEKRVHETLTRAIEIIAIAKEKLSDPEQLRRDCVAKDCNALEREWKDILSRFEFQKRFALLLLEAFYDKKEVST